MDSFISKGRVGTATTRQTFGQTQEEFMISQYKTDTIQKEKQEENQKLIDPPFLKQKEKKIPKKANERYLSQQSNNLKVSEESEKSGSSQEEKDRKKQQNSQHFGQYQQIKIEQENFYQESDSPKIRPSRNPLVGTQKPVTQLNPFADWYDNIVIASQSRSYSEFLQVFNLGLPYIRKTTTTKCGCFTTKEKSTFDKQKHIFIQQGSFLFSENDQEHKNLVFTAYTKLYEIESMSYFQSQIILQENPNVFQLLQLVTCIELHKSDLLQISQNNREKIISLMMVIGAYIFQQLKFSNELNSLCKKQNEQNHSLYNTLRCLQLGAFQFICQNKDIEKSVIIPELQQREEKYYYLLWNNLKKENF